MTLRANQLQLGIIRAIAPRVAGDERDAGDGGVGAYERAGNHYAAA